jgi:hypothetical protein
VSKDYRYGIVLPAGPYETGERAAVVLQLSEGFVLEPGSTLVYDNQRKELVLRFRVAKLPADKEGA